MKLLRPEATSKSRENTTRRVGGSHSPHARHPYSRENYNNTIAKKGLIVAAIAAVSLFALLHRAAAQSTTAFDGNWWVTMGAQDYNNPYNRGLSHAFEFHFPATVTHGVFHGERGTRGEQAFYELNGIIQPDGTALLSASGITRKQEYSQELVPPGTPYSYTVKALFKGPRGTGNSIGARVRIFHFTKK
jgi:hypothetical protein